MKLSDFAPEAMWQQVFPAGTFETPDAGFETCFPATLADGRQIVLPLRRLPGETPRAVSSLILNQAGFEVEDALCDLLAQQLAPHEPEVVIGVPTLGLPLANGTARRLEHARMVPLSTSRKFWYDEALSEPMSSITSPDQVKTIYLDPRMLPVLAGKRVALVDDVASSGKTMVAVLRLLKKAGVAPVALGFAMLQSDRWKEAIAASDFPEVPVVAPLKTPLFDLVPGTSDAAPRWQPMAG
ncbi:phosphoribosyltransferase [Pseudooceanicola nanhaiensis]|uniref:phosphoribosyltransferase n=1 Tax=Pseudooceanicola nanhaiensis TaxID=375761 RepID=UPI001CD1EB54|nr:phosphoribosyltransferase [Pseudooceanicola nanhaiensis]MCA0920883.1 phosphoribosyltransferase [Pseudooceanicola nanhaiensis]